MEKFDSIIIGSSPVAITESIHLAVSGKRVLLIEKNNRLGGAWGSFDFGLYKDIEYGPHTIKPRPGLYGLLRTLGIKLIPMHPFPLRELDESFFGFRFIPWNWRWFEITRTSIKNTPLFYRSYLKIRFFLTLFRKIIERFFLYKRREILYAEGGTQCMVNHLSELAKYAGVEIYANTAVSEIHANTKSKKVEIMTKKCTYLTDELVYTSGTNLDLITIDRIPIQFDDNPQIHVELLLFIDDIRPANFSFVRSSDNDLIIKMFHNISPYVISEEKNKKNTNVILFRMRDGIVKGQKTIDLILEKLKRFGFVTKDARISNSKWINYPIPFRRQERIDELNNITLPLIRGVYTYDLGISMLNHAERWADTLAWIKNNYPK